jgi:hypothetical protein
MNTKARELTSKLQKVYNGNKTQLDFHVSQFVSGDHNKLLRQEIIYQCTGERRPLTKCGMYAVSDALKNKFDQPQLF